MTKRKINWLDFGVSDPLIMGMANHPLTDRLETLAATPVNKMAARSTMTALFLGAIIVSAPLTIAEASANEKLPDTVVRVETDQNSKSVIKVTKKDKNGNDVRKHYEVEINGSDIDAYEVDVAGRRIKIDQSDINGFDANVMANSSTWAFVVDDDMKLAFDPAASDKYAEKHRAHEMKHRIIRLEGDHPDFKDMKQRLIMNGLSEESAREIELRVEQGLRGKNFSSGEGEGEGNIRTFVLNSDAPTPPLPPEVTVLDGVEGPSRIFIKKKGENGHVIRFNHDEMHHINSGEVRLEAAQSMIDSVENMLGDLDEEDQALKDAKRDLEKARRSLQKASEKIKKSQEAVSDYK